MLGKWIVVFCILGPFATIMTSNQTIVWKLKRPVYLRETASIMCIIQENGKPGHMAWKKGGNLIGINNAAFNLTKYDVFVNYNRSSMMYSLLIKNIVMEDFNLVYRCESGFAFAAGILPFNEDTLVALPKKEDTSCIFSLKEGILEVSVGVTYVYPKPKCIVIFKNKDITRYLKTNYTIESTLYSVTFYLFYKTEDCGNISIVCVIGKDERSILKKSHEFKDCKHSNPVPPTDHRNFSEIEVASIIAGAVLLVTMLLFVIYVAYVKRRHLQICRLIVATCVAIDDKPPDVAGDDSTPDVAVNDSTSQGPDDTLPLISQEYFLEDPVNIECREGEDAIFTCKIIAGSPSVKWLKDGYDIAVNHRCVVSWQDITHQLKIKKSQLTDTGEYCAQVGKSSKKVQLQIKEAQENLHDRSTGNDDPKKANA